MSDEALAPPTIVPGVYLFAETLRVDVGDFGIPKIEEIEAPALTLTFDNPRSDPQAEAHARRVLESLGALDIKDAQHVEVPAGSRADFVARIDDDIHGKCSFSAHALPQLRALGWRVVVDANYPWRAADEATSWYARLEPNERADWFNVELGVEIDGECFDLLPALLEILDKASSLEGTLHRRRRVTIQAPGGRFVSVPAKRLRPLLEVLCELYGERTLQPWENAARVPALDVDALARLDRTMNDTAPDDDEALASRLDESARPPRRGQRRLRWTGQGVDTIARARALLTPPDPVDPPQGLRATLRPYQHEGVTWLQHLRRLNVGGILADDMGLGKTLQTIAHLLIEHQTPLRPAAIPERVSSTSSTSSTSSRARGHAPHKQPPSLVIAPTSLVTNWLRELSRFAPDLWVTAYHGSKRARTRRLLPHVDVIVTTYPIVLRDLSLLRNQAFHVVILDEAQMIKNDRSQIHRAVKALQGDHRLCLSGTPLENHLGELWSLFDFLMPRFLGDRTSFVERYRKPIENDGDEDRLRALRTRVAPLILRRTKAQVTPELPKKTEIVRTVELLGAQRELYESIRIAAHAQVRHAISERGLTRSRVAILDALMKLRQVCCDPRLVKMATAREVETSAKYDLFFDLLTTQLAQGRHLLVFSQFTSMLALIGEGLRLRGIAYSHLTGSTKDRQTPIELFSGGAVDVFLISLKAGGTGLNLTRADTVIHYDPWWNPAAQAQATDRAYRIGQTRPVFAYNLVVAGSVEERMLQLQERKRALADGLLSGSSLADISEGELDSLFSPLP
ncbi:MAG: DEAD/DEAH box helicase [Deltaproteobacteria bacterium]|nr:DEAD/DEAH box helicase [Deltaproteobacteria bacterium]